MLETQELSVSYGAVQALKNMNLSVPRGEVTAVIGANGAGKSTLMRTLAGLVKPQSGQVLFDGAVISGHKPEDIVRMGMALVPEGRSTIPELSVEEKPASGWSVAQQAGAHSLPRSSLWLVPHSGRTQKHAGGHIVRW